MKKVWVLSYPFSTQSSLGAQIILLVLSRGGSFSFHSDESVKNVKDSATEKSNTSNKALVKQEIESDTEENSTEKVTFGEQNCDSLKDIVKKDEDVLDSSMEETVFPKECHVCKELFNNMKSFSKHVKTHNVKTKGRRRNKQEVWPCCVCGRQLTTAVRQACHHYSKHGIPYDESLKLHTCDVEVSFPKKSKNSNTQKLLELS